MRGRGEMTTKSNVSELAGRDGSEQQGNIKQERTLDQICNDTDVVTLWALPMYLWLDIFQMRTIKKNLPLLNSVSGLSPHHDPG